MEVRGGGGGGLAARLALAGLQVDNQLAAAARPVVLAAAAQARAAVRVGRVRVATILLVCVECKGSQGWGCRPGRAQRKEWCGLSCASCHCRAVLLWWRAGAFALLVVQGPSLPACIGMHGHAHAGPLTRRASAQAASAGPGAAPRPFLEARLELAAHNASILYLKHVSLAVQARAAQPRHTPQSALIIFSWHGCRAACQRRHRCRRSACCCQHAQHAPSHARISSFARCAQHAVLPSASASPPRSPMRLTWTSSLLLSFERLLQPACSVSPLVSASVFTPPLRAACAPALSLSAAPACRRRRTWCWRRTSWTRWLRSRAPCRSATSGRPRPRPRPRRPARRAAPRPRAPRLRCCQLRSRCRCLDYVLAMLGRACHPCGGVWSMSTSLARRLHLLQLSAALKLCVQLMY